MKVCQTITLQEVWRRAAGELGLEVVTPFECKLDSGHTLVVEVLLANFGAPKGMLIVGDYLSVAERGAEIVESGYGFSVLEPTLLESQYDLSEIVEMLQDWSWSGRKEERPPWIDGRQPED